MRNGNNKKVAFVATVYRHLEVFHLPYIKSLQKMGFEVHAYGNIDNGKESLIDNGVICHDIAFKRNPFKISNLTIIKRMIKSFTEESFCFVHFHTPVASIIGRIAAKIAKVPYVIYTAHGFHFFKGAPIHYWLMYYPVEKLMARWTDCLITINEEDYKVAQNFKVRDYVKYVPGVGVEKLDIENSEEIIKGKKKEFDITEENFVILCVAELNKNKNHMQLIDSMEKLVVDFPNIKCLIAGEGEDKEKLINITYQKRLEKNILFLGYRRDITELMLMCDVVTLLSKREGLPKALLEALTLSKPIVATNVRGSKDLVENEVNGYLVEVDDMDGTFKAFKRLVEREQDLEELGKNSGSKSDIYQLQEVIKEVQKIYGRANKNIMSMSK